jgi:hypothetical protein
MTDFLPKVSWLIQADELLGELVESRKTITSLEFKQLLRDRLEKKAKTSHNVRQEDVGQYLRHSYQIIVHAGYTRRQEEDFGDPAQNPTRSSLTPPQYYYVYEPTTEKKEQPTVTTTSERTFYLRNGANERAVCIVVSPATPDLLTVGVTVWNGQQPQDHKFARNVAAERCRTAGNRPAFWGRFTVSLFSEPARSEAAKAKSETGFVAPGFNTVQRAILERILLSAKNELDDGQLASFEIVPGKLVRAAKRTLKGMEKAYVAAAAAAAAAATAAVGKKPVYVNEARQVIKGNGNIQVGGNLAK